MLSVAFKHIMLSVIVLTVAMLIDVILSVVMLGIAKVSVIIYTECCI